jgi:hypothetical protein
MAQWGEQREKLDQDNVTDSAARPTNHQPCLVLRTLTPIDSVFG